MAPDSMQCTPSTVGLDSNKRNIEVISVKFSTSSFQNTKVGKVLKINIFITGCRITADPTATIVVFGHFNWVLGIHRMLVVSWNKVHKICSLYFRTYRRDGCLKIYDSEHYEWESLVFYHTNDPGEKNYFLH